jgi:hypothetical protein
MLVCTVAIYCCILNNYGSIISEILTVVTMNNIILVVTPCSLVNDCQSFGGNSPPKCR